MSRAKYVLIVAAAFLVAEGLLRVTESSRNHFIGALHPTAYVERPLLGPIFGRPYYQGVLNIPGERRSTWITLDADGLRPVPSTSTSGPKIVVMGGASQTFGFGVADEQTWPEQMTKHISAPVRTRMLSLPGVSILREWEELNADPGLMANVSIVILSLYRSPIEFPKNDDITKAPDLFLIDGRLEQMTASELSVYRTSRAIFGIYRGTQLAVRDLINSRASQIIYRVIRGIFPQNSQLQLVAPSDSTTLSSSDAESLRAFVSRLEDRVRPNGRVFVVALPSEKLPRDHFHILMSLLPASVMTLDLHAALIDSIKPQDLTNDGHYRAALNQTIGAEIAHAICHGTARHQKLLDYC